MMKNFNEGLERIEKEYKKDMIKAYCKGVKDANEKREDVCEGCKFYETKSCMVRDKGAKNIDFLYELVFEKGKKEATKENGHNLHEEEEHYDISGADEDTEEGIEVITSYECPTCGADMKEEDNTCVECGEEFEEYANEDEAGKLAGSE